MTTNVPPQWFVDAITTRPLHDSVVVDGSSISYRTWGEHGAPVVVLIHGSAAHSGWWDHIGPQLAVTHRVIALDLSGHGDSDRRRDYSVDGWAEEVCAVVEHAGDGGCYDLVGHSLGAFVALRVPLAQPRRVKGILAVDPPLRPIEPGMQEQRARLVASSPATYPTREEAMSRWRPAPRQDVLPWVRDHIAADSVTGSDGVWGWKFDLRTFDRPEIGPDDWVVVPCIVDVLRAGQGMLSVAMADHLVAALGPTARWDEISSAGHHVMLDQPLELVAAAQQMLSRAQDVSDLPPHPLDGDNS